MLGEAKATLKPHHPSFIQYLTFSHCNCQSKKTVCRIVLVTSGRTEFLAKGQKLLLLPKNLSNLRTKMLSSVPMLVFVAITVKFAPCWPWTELALQSLQALAGGAPYWHLVQQCRSALPGWVAQGPGRSPDPGPGPGA